MHADAEDRPPQKEGGRGQVPQVPEEGGVKDIPIKPPVFKGIGNIIGE